MLLAGIGNVDSHQKRNYLIVDNSNNTTIAVCLFKLFILVAAKKLVLKQLKNVSKISQVEEMLPSF